MFHLLWFPEALLSGKQFPAPVSSAFLIAIFLPREAWIAVECNAMLEKSFLLVSVIDEASSAKASTRRSCYAENGSMNR